VAIRGEKCELINFGICCFDELFNGFLLCEYLQNETELFEYCSNSKTNKMRKVSKFFSNWPHSGSTFPLLRRRCFCCEWNWFDGVVGMSRSPWLVTDWPRELGQLECLISGGGNESSRTCLKFDTNSFFSSSSARLKFTSSSVRLVRFSSFAQIT
jgi:hypothetical protein